MFHIHQVNAANTGAFSSIQVVMTLFLLSEQRISLAKIVDFLYRVLSNQRICSSHWLTCCRMSRCSLWLDIYKTSREGETLGITSVK